MTLKPSVGDSPELEWFKSSYSDSSNSSECVEVALEWFKSSYSGSSNPNNCVEMALGWLKSSHSSSEAGDCVEIAPTPTKIHLRDSKNPQGPQLTFAPTTWATFLPYATRA
ncbi:DUF397 domain-containing protein [Streptomyces sp. NPDC091209]|uniref:DUF397 domain-containing protein n=1 Tax=Streptomyces sp. NPDC091209 TaxID=3365974 RepID=UPI00381741F1